MRRLRIVLAWLLFVVAPVLGGAVAYAFSAAMIPVPGLWAMLALMVCAWLALATGKLAFRVRGTPFAENRARPFAAGLVTVFGLAGWWLLYHRPPAGPRPLPDRGAVEEMWKLSTGSEVAVIPVGTATASAPIVFLHGGPGGCVRPADVAFFRALSDRGFRVYLFDQAGGGASKPLPITEYSVARAVADLEALRARIGAPKLTLVGQSWGTRLGYEYIVAHPDRVEQAAFLSPAPMRGDQIEFALERTAAHDLGRPKFPPWVMAAFLLAKLDVRSMAAFASKDELNDGAGRAAAANAARWVCKGDPVPELDPAGLDVQQTIAMRAELERVDASPPPPSPPPALVVRGACDFIRWEAARDLRDRLGAQLVPLPEVGHALWPKRSALVLDLLTAFLRGEPLPAAAYPGATEP